MAFCAMQQRFFDFDKAVQEQVDHVAEATSLPPPLEAKAAPLVRPDRQITFDGAPHYEWPAAKHDRDTITVDRIHDDKRLRTALGSLDSIEAYENLDAFFGSDAGRALMEQSELSKLWKKDSAQILSFIATNEAPFVEAVKNAVWGQLPGYLEVEGAIPSDNGTAIISSVQDIAEVRIDWTQQEEFAPGWVFVPFAVECELELDFEVYRSNAFDVPKWVHVSFGDFERDHYFEASGCQPARVTGQLRLQFTAAQLRDRTWQIPAMEVDFEDAELASETLDESGDDH